MHFSRFISPGLAFAGLGILTAAAPCAAQDPYLFIGGSNGMSQPGNGQVTITTTGTAASGIIHTDAASLTTTSQFSLVGVYLGSDLTVTGGKIFSVNTYDTSTVIFSGGTAQIFQDNGTGPNLISGGTVSDVYDDGSMLNITGGNLSDLTTFTGGNVDIFGTGLALNKDHITGTLQNGDPLNVAYRNGGGQLFFNTSPVPEPSFIATSACGGLGLAGLVVRACRGGKASAAQQVNTG